MYCIQPRFQIVILCIIFYYLLYIINRILFYRVAGAITTISAATQNNNNNMGTFFSEYARNISFHTTWTRTHARKINIIYSIYNIIFQYLTVKKGSARDDDCTSSTKRKTRSSVMQSSLQTVDDPFYQLKNANISLLTIKNKLLYYTSRRISLTTQDNIILFS